MLGDELRRASCGSHGRPARGPVAAVAAGDGLVTPLGRALPPLLKPVVLGEARCTVV